MAKDKGLAGATAELEADHVEKPRVYATLEALATAEAAKLANDGVRAYAVASDHERVFVATNSPGNAALATVSVRRLTDRELKAAAFAALTARDLQASAH